MSRRLYQNWTLLGVMQHICSNILEDMRDKGLKVITKTKAFIKNCFGIVELQSLSGCPSIWHRHNMRGNEGTNKKYILWEQILNLQPWLHFTTCRAVYMISARLFFVVCKQWQGQFQEAQHRLIGTTSLYLYFCKSWLLIKQLKDFL